MVKDKKVIIFDLDGTLIDSVGIWNAIDEDVIRTINNGKIDDINIEKQRELILNKFSKSKDMYTEYCGFLKDKYNPNMTKEEVNNLRNEVASKYLKKHIDYKPNAEKVLKYLKSKGFILVIASTTANFTIDIYKNFNENIISKADLDDIFELIYTKDFVKEQKPNPEIYYKIFEKLNVKPDDCLVIEDSLIGVKAARNANVDVVAMYDKYSDFNREKINQLSQYQFNDFNEMLKYIENELGE